ncbi:hypothetical protein PUNSTDRAFT_120220 [Punctularia strigosozonata HHB-11173 SS5]|uniref:uncharacterized protein n=1 Tax=Punctularia strigosozonata (strain HHB-11173) TaxID=741275 RepID=UPI0004416ACB|nr:uncharacterized protein PUNSTDRAFT_120220 [Punctularia strigosozonata HHB-11173 SS5]EIN09969.1 hypothetical protein PUNSTDRAFT_120220 [Punctularia strigosozonata HHB-11173 SS5]
MAASAQNQGFVSGEQYRYALSQFRIAHEQVEQQRQQMEEQERQIAMLRSRIATLEGEDFAQPHSASAKSSVDDFSVKNAASRLEKLINRWAGDIVRSPPLPLADLQRATLEDINDGSPSVIPDTSAMKVQSLLRHVMSEVIADGVVNCLIVTDSAEANIQLSRIHEHIFSRDATVACVWRRQTFSAAIEAPSTEMTTLILQEQMPNLFGLFSPPQQSPIMHAAIPLLQSATEFSRMLHGSNPGGSGAADTFYRAFVPELGSPLDPRQVELVKRCVQSDKGAGDRVGATVFFGLVKISREGHQNVQTVVRRAQVICECALAPLPYA